MSLRLRLIYYHVGAEEAEQYLNYTGTKIIEEFREIEHVHKLPAAAAASATPTIVKIPLQFVHPTKELWIILREDLVGGGPNYLTSIDAGSDHVDEITGVRRAHPAGAGGGAAAQIEYAELSFNGTKTTQVPIDRKYMQERIVPSAHQHRFDNAIVPVYCLNFAKYPDKNNFASGHANFGQVAHAELTLGISHEDNTFTNTNTCVVQVIARQYNWVTQCAGQMYKVYH